MTANTDPAVQNTHVELGVSDETLLERCSYSPGIVLRITDKISPDSRIISASDGSIDDVGSQRPMASM